MKILVKKGDRRFLARDENKDMHTQYGFIKSKDLKKRVGSKLMTNKNVEMTLLKADFLDKLSKIKRGAQIIPLKDIGSIIAETGINNKSVIIDGGAGSGYMALYFSHVAKKVITYEIRQDHFDLVKENIDFLGANNIEIKNKDIYQGIDEKNVDLVNLDLPEPWLVLEHAMKSVKIGGYIVSYSPTIPQVMDFIRESNNFDVVHIKTIEIIEREWDVFGRKVRPKSQSIGHSGFLSFLRRLS